MKTIRNFFLFMFVFVLLLGGASFWFLHSSALSSYESVENGKKAVNSYVENWFTTQKNSGIEWALDKVNYKPQEAKNTNDVKSTNEVKDVTKATETKPENISDLKKNEVTKDAAKPVSVDFGSGGFTGNDNKLGMVEKTPSSEVDFSRVNSMDFIVKDGVNQVALLDKDKNVVVTLKTPFIKNIKNPTTEELKMLGEFIGEQCGNCSLQMSVRQSKTISVRESVLGALFGG